MFGDRVEVFLTAAFFAGTFLATAFLAGAFFAGAFLATGFFAAVFFAGADLLFFLNNFLIATSTP